MIICESIFDTPDPRQPGFSMEEVDMFAHPFSLTLRKNLSTREYELIDRDSDTILASSASFDKILVESNDIVHRYHPEVTNFDTPCIHYGTQRDASCKMVDEKLERFLCAPLEASMTDLEVKMQHIPVDETLYATVIEKFGGSNNPIVQEFVAMYARDDIYDLSSKIFRLYTDLKVLVRDLANSVTMHCRVCEKRDGEMVYLERDESMVHLVGHSDLRDGIYLICPRCGDRYLSKKNDLFSVVVRKDA